MRELLNSLSGMRFIAAALIAFHHTAWMYPLSKYIDDHIDADLGVTFFFVLSGFILYYTHNNISTKSQSIRFIVARIARIWPLHVACLLMVLCIFPSPWGYPGESVAWLKILANLFLMHAWIPYAKYFFSFNGPSWSISVELFFYVLFPFLLYRFKKNWHFKLILAFITGLAVVMAVQKMALPMLHYGDPLMGPNQWASGTLPLVRLTEFLTGILACAFWLRIKKKVVDNSYLFTCLEVASLLLGLFTLCWFPHIISISFDGYVLGSWLTRTLAAPMFATIIAVFAFGRGAPSKFIGCRWMVLLGEASFSLYMTHEIVARCIANYAPSVLFKDSYWLGPLIFWTLCLSVSFATWKIIERPCRKFILARFDSHVRKPNMNATSQKQSNNVA
ncbi:acyltransferase [Pantoea sp. YU22]|uniref:acyltransferase family protein n=1 Tax=Pantoea TaxID=53335 RepID=UPI000F89A8F1|nr:MULTISPECIES: acyltransferase [Pantoea]RTY60029.1 acyltransferase [Pantoea sp. YU22]